MTSACLRAPRHPAGMLEEVLMRVLEQRAFLLTAPAQRIAGWRIEDPMHAVVRFSGTEVGWLRLTLPRGLLDALEAEGFVLVPRPGTRSACDAVLCRLAGNLADEFVLAYFGNAWAGVCAVPDVRVAPPRPPQRSVFCRASLVTEGAHPLESEMVVLAREH